MNEKDSERKEHLECAMQYLAQCLTYEDARFLEEGEKKRITTVVSLVFFDLRGLAIENKIEQIKDLVQAFHNVLLYIDEKFSLDRLISDVKIYQDKYKDNLLIDYLVILEKIKNGE